MDINNIMEDNNNKYYIYTHSNKDGVFYIGKGTGDRAYMTNRSLQWKEYAGDDCEVSIILDGLTNDEAISAERDMIMGYDGVLINKHHNCNRNNEYKSNKDKIKELGDILTNYYR